MKIYLDWYKVSRLCLTIKITIIIIIRIINYQKYKN